MLYQDLIAHFADVYRERGIFLDDFQQAAITALTQDSDVLVSAPTGAGKTVVAEFAIELAFARELRCVYTAPIKALSNQKYRELSERYGQAQIGLLTGDTVINRDAQILVVTTEVLRNMLFAQDSSLHDIGYVVLDEVHYLGDKSRGPVWEELILQLPQDTRLVALSATIANSAEFTAWLRTVRPAVTFVESKIRPVPLSQAMLNRGKLIELYRNTQRHISVNSPQDTAVSQPDSQFELQAVQRAIESENQRSNREGRDLRRGRGSNGKRLSAVFRKKIALQLRNLELLPAIEFIFSRKGCDQAVQDLLEREVSFTTDAQRKIIRKKLGHLRRALNAEERKAIQFGLWEKAILRGFAAHHAGMFPALKELIEELTAAGFLSLIYATGTLALGINMPVRTVVLEELYKWNGDSFEDLSGTEYTQLIGRAGRRGKDQLGTAVILARPHTDIELLAKLSSGELERLNSVFFPSYNTVVNLIGNYGYRDARLIMGTSFAQYQLNSQLGEIQGKLARISRKIHAHSADLATLCQKGNLPQYLELRMKAGRASKAARRKAKSEYRRSIAASWREMQNGILYAIALAGEVTYGVVLSHNERRARIISLYGDLEWIYANQVSAPLRNLGEFLLPHGLSPKQAAAREIISQKLFRQLSERIELEQDADLIGAQDRFAVRETPELLAHPVHHCRDLAAHLIVAEEYLSLVNRRQALEAKADASHDSIARQFDAAAQVLKKLGFLQSDTDISIRKTDTGVLSSQNNPDCELRLGIGGDFLRAIHTENDLLLALCLNESVLHELNAAQFAGICAGFLGDKRISKLPIADPKLRAAWKRIDANYWFLRDLEAKHGIDLTAEPNSSGVQLFTLWADGATLPAILKFGRIEVGDFIGSTRRLLDLLSQLARAGADSWIGKRADTAIHLIRRWDWL